MVGFAVPVFSISPSLVPFSVAENRTVESQQENPEAPDFCHHSSRHRWNQAQERRCSPRLED